MINSTWPLLDYQRNKDVYTTFHMFTQIAGKIRMKFHPVVNHSWHVTLYLTPVGFTTGLIPHDKGCFEILFDVQSEELIANHQSGKMARVAYRGMSVAEFYQQLTTVLADLGIDSKICTTPNEVSEPIAFEKDEKHHHHDKAALLDFHKALLLSEKAMHEFRSGFKIKCSPVHFFWGSFDLVVSVFSGRTAPEHPAGIPGIPDKVVREAYSYEVFSCGFWPGNEMFPQAAYYAYIYPKPVKFESEKVKPRNAYFDQQLQELILPYSEVITGPEPGSILLEFFNTAFRAAERSSGHSWT